MISLCVQFPHTQWPGWLVPEYVLNPSDNATSLPLKTSHKDSHTLVTIAVDPETDADYGSDTAVFRGRMHSEDDIGDARPFALKFAFRNDLASDLAQEAQLYESVLKPLQGSTVPLCYGLFHGVGEDGQEIACLVLEYWGETLSQPFSVLPLTLRFKILERLGELHECGIHHGDFAERNVLTCGDDVRVIDFDQTEFHECDCNAAFNFAPGNKPPNIETFGCSMLWEICHSEMRIWDETIPEYENPSGEANIMAV